MTYDCASLEQLTHFYHACCFSPVPDTWVNAINNDYFWGWLNLTAKNVHLFLTNKPATIMGHLQQNKQGVRSTKIAVNLKDANIDMPEQEKEWRPKWWCSPEGFQIVALSSSINLKHLKPCWAEYNNTNTALLDSEASLTLVKNTALGEVSTITHTPKTITIPNGMMMTTTANLVFNLLQLPPKAQTAYLLPSLVHNLLALPQLCNNGCEVTFTKN